MTKIPGIKPAIRVSSVVNTAPKTQQLKIGNSGLPYEMPLDSFHKEQDLINKLDPSTPFENARRAIQNSLESFK